MSTAIICDRQFAKVFNTLKHNRAVRENKEELKDKMESLKLLNYKSYSNRYDELTDYEKFESVKNAGVYTNNIALIKSLQCILYNINTETEITEYFRDIIYSLMKKVIYDLPEYEQAKWFDEGRKEANQC